MISGGMVLGPEQDVEIDIMSGTIKPVVVYFR
jgi:hypothetical protein